MAGHYDSKKKLNYPFFLQQHKTPEENEGKLTRNAKYFN